MEVLPPPWTAMTTTGIPEEADMSTAMATSVPDTRERALIGAQRTGNENESVDRNGRVDFSRPIRRLSEAEALALLRPTGTPIPPPDQPTPVPRWWQRLANLITGKKTT